MKAFLVILIFSIVGILVISETIFFAQATYEPGLTVTTNESSYNMRNTILISGNVSYVIPDALITIHLWKGGDIIYGDELEPDKDGTYSYKLNTRDTIWTQGTYVIIAKYGDQDIAKTLFKLGDFKLPKKLNSFNADSSETEISVKMTGGDKFYLNSANQVIRAFVEIQNYSPSDGNYFMKVTHIPTKKILKDFEILPKYSGNGLFSTHIAYPLLETDLKSLNQTMTGRYMIQVGTLYGDKTARTQFSILTSPYESIMSEPKTETPISDPSTESTAPSSEISITAAIDKSFYQKGDAIMVTGNVSKIFMGYALGMKVISPTGNDVTEDQILPNFDGSFVYNLDTNKIYENFGNYKIHLFYGGEDSSKDLYFLLSNGTKLTSEPINNTNSSFESDQSIIPDWVKNIMSWYLDGKISERELSSNLKYLIKQGFM